MPVKPVPPSPRLRWPKKAGEIDKTGNAREAGKKRCHRRHGYGAEEDGKAGKARKAVTLFGINV